MLGLGSPARPRPSIIRPGRCTGIVPYPPGGTTDILARLSGQYLSDNLGQQFIIEKQAGRRQQHRHERWSISAPTLHDAAWSIRHGINATLYKRLNFNLLRDMAPVAGITACRT